MSEGPRREGEELPVDERLIMPESRYEVIDGGVVYVAPSDPPHASRHSKLSALLEAHAADAYDVACDMLTRTSERDDFAPDASVYPSAPHPETGGRQLEELAFEVVSTQSLSAAATKARKLLARGVRRVFALDVERKRALELSRQTGTWEILGPDAELDDPCLAAPIPVAALAGAAKVDDAMARALLRKNNPVLAEALRARTEEGRDRGRAEGRRRGEAEGRRRGEAEGRAAGKAQAVLAVLRGRGLEVSDVQARRILSERDEAVLDAWLSRAGRCENARALLMSGPPTSR
jgi:Uma2 family endonuclease